MKRHVILVAALLSVACLNAQPLTNHLYFSGSLGFSTSSGEMKQGPVITQQPTTTTVNVSPSIGYTVTDNILLGVRTLFTNTNVDDPNGPDQATQNFGVAAFGRYYVPIVERFFFYPELLIGFGSGRTETSDNGITVTNPETSTFLTGVVAGFAYYPSTHWGVELSTGAIGFASTKSTNPTTAPVTETTTNTFGFGVDGITVNVGVSYLLQLSRN